MSKKNQFLFGFVTLLAFFQINFAQETCTAFIDAITSPTAKFTTLAGSQYCATSATIKWKDFWDNGTRLIQWDTSTSYGNTIVLSGKTGTATLAPLTPNTTYYWRVKRSYKTVNILTPAGSFTTSGAPVQPPVITSALSVSCTTGTTTTYTATATDPANKPVTFTFGEQFDWITSSGATLTLTPTATSQNAIVKIIASNGTADDTLNLSVSVFVSTGVLCNRNAGKQIPVSIGKTQFFIPFTDEKAITVSLFSLDGALLMKRTVSIANTTMDRSIHLGSQMSGTYICKVHTQAGEISKKIVMQK